MMWCDGRDRYTQSVESKMSETATRDRTQQWQWQHNKQTKHFISRRPSIPHQQLQHFNKTKFHMNPCPPSITVIKTVESDAHGMIISWNKDKSFVIVLCPNWKVKRCKYYVGHPHNLHGMLDTFRTISHPSTCTLLFSAILHFVGHQINFTFLFFKATSGGGDEWHYHKKCIWQQVQDSGTRTIRIHFVIHKAACW